MSRKHLSSLKTLISLSLLAALSASIGTNAIAEETDAAALAGKLSYVHDVFLEWPVLSTKDLPDNVAIRVYADEKAEQPIWEKSFPRGEYMVDFEFNKSDGNRIGSVARFTVNLDTDGFKQFIESESAPETVWIEFAMNGNVQGGRSNVASNEIGSALSSSMPIHSDSPLPEGAGDFVLSSERSVTPRALTDPNNWQVGTGGIYYNYNNGKVGIGTSTPQAALDLGGGDIYLNGADTSSGSSTRPGLLYQYTGRMDFGWGARGGSNMEFYARSPTGATAGNIHFIYGGESGSGQIKFMNYAGSASTGSWSTRAILTADGRLGIGTTAPCADCKLAVNGKIRAKELVIDSGWADYVFEDSYRLRPLEEVEQFIKENGHLPGMPTTAEVQSNGMDVSASVTALLEKTEELTLYVIQLKKENEKLRQEVANLSN